MNAHRPSEAEQLLQRQIMRKHFESLDRVQTKLKRAYFVGGLAIGLLVGFYATMFLTYLAR